MQEELFNGKKRLPLKEALKKKRDQAAARALTLAQLHTALEKVPLSHDSAPETSGQAAWAKWEGNARSQRVKVLVLIALSEGGLTDHEGAEVTGYRCHTSRRCELRDQGLVYDTGARRPSPYGGSPCAVWAATAPVIALMHGPLP